GLETSLDGAGVQTLGPGECIGRGGVLPVVGSSERTDPGEAGAGDLLAALHLHQHAVPGPDSSLYGASDGDTLHGIRAWQGLGDGAGWRIVDPDNRGGNWGKMGENPRLN